MNALAPALVTKINANMQLLFPKHRREFTMMENISNKQLSASATPKPAPTPAPSNPRDGVFPTDWANTRKS